MIKSLNYIDLAERNLNNEFLESLDGNEFMKKYNLSKNNELRDKVKDSENDRLRKFKDRVYEEFVTSGGDLDILDDKVKPGV